MKIKIKTRNKYEIVKSYIREIEIPNDVTDIEGYIYENELHFEDECYGYPLCNGKVISSIKLDKEYVETDDSFEIVK